MYVTGHVLVNDFMGVLIVLYLFLYIILDYLITVQLMYNQYI